MALGSSKYVAVALGSKYVAVALGSSKYIALILGSCKLKLWLKEENKFIAMALGGQWISNNGFRIIANKKLWL